MDMENIVVAGFQSEFARLIEVYGHGAVQEISSLVCSVIDTDLSPEDFLESAAT